MSEAWTAKTLRIPRTAADIYFEGLRSLEAGSLEEAIAAFQRALQLAPRYYALYHHLFEAYSRLEQLEAALETYHKLNHELESYREKIRPLLEYNPGAEGVTPDRSISAWSKHGSGNASIIGKMLRIVGLGEQILIFCNERLTINLDLPFGVEVIVRRRGSDEEDCGLEIADGKEGEAIRWNHNLLILKSNSQIYRLNTESFHIYRLVCWKAGSRLYVDGRLRLTSPRLMGLPQQGIRFGITKGLYGGDSENHWLILKAFQTSTGGEDGADILAPLPHIETVHYNMGLFYWNEGKFLNAAEEFYNALRCDPNNFHIQITVKEFLREQRERARLPRITLQRLLSSFPAEEQRELDHHGQFCKSQSIIRMQSLGLRFAKNPHKILSLKDLYLALWKPRNYFDRDRYWWVLKDIFCELEAGDILGVIGKNGAGKSTLLRVLAGMIPPDEGSIELEGRPLLLTPGLGFREELSGRDNIYFGGLFLGLTKREIAEQFDDIVDFAELRDVIDRPFKYYSDGMKARLIFSVATSVAPDILLLDELLGAGDAAFQEKAAARMQDLIRKAKTIVVVTHNMAFVREQCTKALYLDQGRVRYYGDANRAVDLYLNDLNLTSTPVVHG